MYYLSVDILHLTPSLRFVSVPVLCFIFSLLLLKELSACYSEIFLDKKFMLSFQFRPQRYERNILFPSKTILHNALVEVDVHSFVNNSIKLETKRNLLVHLMLCAMMNMLSKWKIYRNLSVWWKGKQQAHVTHLQNVCWTTTS